MNQFERFTRNGKLLALGNKAPQGCPEALRAFDGFDPQLIKVSRYICGETLFFYAKCPGEADTPVCRNCFLKAATKIRIK